MNDLEKKYNILDKLTEKYYNQIYTENNFINERINWLLAIQSILFAAYSFILKERKPNIQKIVAFTGIFINLFIAKGIIGAYLSINRTWKTWEIINNLEGNGYSFYPQPLEGHGYGIIPSFGIILVLLAGWNFLIGMIKKEKFMDYEEAFDYLHAYSKKVSELSDCNKIKEVLEQITHFHKKEDGRKWYSLEQLREYVEDKMA